MTTKTQNQSAKQEKAIIALLSESNLEKAAARAGVSESALWRWLNQDSAFQEAYAHARRKALETAISRLSAAAGAAVTMLLKTMVEATAESVRLRAAQLVLDFAIKGIEQQEMKERLGRVEEMLDKMETAP